MQLRSLLFLSGVLLACCFFSVSCNSYSDIPKYDHVIVVIEENHGYSKLIGSSLVPYINRLAEGGALFTNSHGVTHPSQPNYLALFSGSTQNVTDDNCLESVTPYTTPNLAAALIRKKYTFKGYAQTMPSAGYTDCKYEVSPVTDAYLYARKHAPWINWQGNKKNNIPPSVSLPMTQFPTDFTQLPTVAFVIPDMDHDMHNLGGAGGDTAALVRGDQWLQDNISAYAEWAKTHNSLLIVTYDEDDYENGKNNQIPTIFYGANIKAGKYNEYINHYSVLHTLEAMYHLPIADTTSATPITDVWNNK